jgi:hypothetical protein
MDNASSYLFMLGNDKREINSFIEALKSEVSSVDPFKLHGVITALMKGLQEVKELNAKEIVLDGKHEAYGFTFASKEAGTKYDYSNCNHPDWINYSKQIEDYSKAKKSIEDTLKTIKDPITLVDEQTGDIITVNPPIKKSTTIIEVR